MNPAKIKEWASRATNQSITGKVVLIIGLFVFIAIVLGGMIYLQGRIFDGVRVYVRGEGLWAKGQKDAVIYLERYSHSHAEDDYRAFLQAVETNLGDHAARKALLATPPDLQAAATGFAHGQNDPEDIDALIWFFQHFQSISYMHQAIAIWTDADQKIKELLEVGQAIRQEIQSGAHDTEKLNSLRSRVNSLNIELLTLENRFSSVLGEGARWVKQATLIASLTLLLLFVSLAMIISRQLIAVIAQTERELKISESRFRSLKESNTIGILSWRMDGTLDEANKHFLDMLGYSEVEFREGRLNWRDLTPAAFRARDEQTIAELLEHGSCTPFEKAFLHKDGHPVPVYIGAALLNGEVNQGIAYIMDLKERKQTEKQLRLAAVVFDSSHDGILVTDADMRIVSVNQALCEMSGYTESELIGQIPSILQSGYTTVEQYHEMLTALYGPGHWQGDIVDRKKHGALLPVHISISAVRNEEQQVSHYVAIISDNAERKAEEEHLRHIAHHDTLTGLPNRVLFNDRIEQLIKRSERNGGRFAILFFDLDNFKPVNDNFGHAVGDKLLQTVANRLTQHVRGTDTVTRLGGDEFVILLEEVANRDSAEKLLQNTVASVSAPCTINGHDLTISVSAGISLYPDDGTDIKALMHHADQAMYHMKQKSRPKQLQTTAPRA